MRVLDPRNSLTKIKDGLFLAGPSSRVPGETVGWREDMIKVLSDQGFSGTVLNPELPESSMTPESYSERTKWEQDAIKIASILVFWIPRTSKHPALTTNIELGAWLEHPRAFVGWPPGSLKNEYIAERCRQCGKKFYSMMEELVRDIMIEMEKPSRIFLTSDTHFGVERTLHTSRRPFRTVEEMDLQMISNWNKTVRNKDVVIHLGDFGEFAELERLNGQVYLVRGNHEGEYCPIPQSVKIIENGKKVKLGKNEYRLVHEPVHGSKFSGSSSDIFLYGHIHRTSMIKRNGVNVGVDCHRLTPVSLDEIEYLVGGIKNYYDVNVFSDRVIT